MTEYPINEDVVPDVDDLSALLIFDKVAHNSSIFSTTAPHFCQQNVGFLAIAFHIYSAPFAASTDFALFLIILMRKLHGNGFEPTLQHISYAFGLHDIFGLAVLSGNVEEWYHRLKDDSMVGSYRGILDIPFVTWPIFNDEIKDGIPLNIDFARYILLCISHFIL